MQSSKLALLVVFLTVAVAGTASAVVDFVAIKRSAGLSVTTALDATFQNAIGAETLTVHTDASSGGQDLVNDAYLYTAPATNARTYNYGISPGVPGTTSGAMILTRFELSGLPNFAGGQVVKAQLRYYLGDRSKHTGLEDNGIIALGNRGGYVTFGSWSEGTKNGTFPGVNPGATFHGPNATNINNTSPPAWSGGTTFGSAKDGVQVNMSRVVADYTGDMVAGNPTIDGFIAFDVTPIVQLWANDTANYGFFIPQAQRSPVLQFSETTVGAEFQPTLFIAYEQAPEPATVCLLAASLAGMVLRRRY